MWDSQDLAKRHAEEAEDVAKHAQDIAKHTQDVAKHAEEVEDVAKHAQELPSKPTHLRFPQYYSYISDICISFLKMKN